MQNCLLLFLKPAANATAGPGVNDSYNAKCYQMDAKHGTVGSWHRLLLRIRISQRKIVFSVVEGTFGGSLR